MERLSESEARVVIENFKQKLGEGSERYGYGKRDTDLAGIAYELNALVDEMITAYGIQAAGMALEEARESIDLSDPYLYYEARSGSAAELAQDEVYEKFVAEMEECVAEAEIILEEEEEEDTEIPETETPWKEPEEKEAEEPEPVPKPKEKPKTKKQQNKEDYRRLRKNLLSLVRRRKKSLTLSDFGYTAPKIPKKITQGSVNRLVKEIAKIKKDYPLR